MIELNTWLWLAAGGAAGLFHATVLWRSARRVTAWTPVLGILRVGSVAGVLLAAAMSGQILAAAAGWLLGFAISAVTFYLLSAGEPS